MTPFDSIALALDSKPVALSRGAVVGDADDGLSWVGDGGLLLHLAEEAWEEVGDLLSEAPSCSISDAELEEASS